MLFKNPRRLLSEAATADLLNPEVSEEVEDVIEELEDVLTNNVEEVSDEDKTTNGGIPVTTESVALMESHCGYGDARYLVRLEDVISIMEAEGEAEAADQMEEPGQAPTPEEAEAAEPEPENVIEDIADKNGVEPDQVAVVISSESMKMLAENVIMEAKCGRKGKKKAKNKGKLAKMLATMRKLKNKGIKLVKA